jgi:hypothetical protein
MAVSTMTAPEVERRQRLTKWLIGAASVVEAFAPGTFIAVMCAAAFIFISFLLPDTRGRSMAEIQQMWEDRFRRSSHSPQAEEVA